MEEAVVIKLVVFPIIPIPITKYLTPVATSIFTITTASSEEDLTITFMVIIIRCIQTFPIITSMSIANVTLLVVDVITRLLLVIINRIMPATTANNSYSTISGGNNNLISCSKNCNLLNNNVYVDVNGSTISGGTSNQITSDSHNSYGTYTHTNSTIGGGYKNLIHNSKGATIVGGGQNLIYGYVGTNYQYFNYATVCGGFKNTAIGNYSWAGGNNAKAYNKVLLFGVVLVAQCSIF